ncbi:hypothetical protein THAOC_08743, partial [Thalassiosira oceanica]
MEDRAKADEEREERTLHTIKEMEERLCQAEDSDFDRRLDTAQSANEANETAVKELTQRVTTLSSKVGVLESDEKVRIRNSVNFQNIKPVVFEVFNKDFAPACKKHADNTLPWRMLPSKDISSEIDRIKEHTEAAQTVASDLETTRSDAEALLAKFHAVQLGSALSDLDDLQARDAADDDFDARRNPRTLRRSGAGGDDDGHGGGDDGDGDGGGDS